MFLTISKKIGIKLIIIITLIITCSVSILAHPLGNFTINHFTRLQIEQEKLSVRYVVDLAEIPTFQEIQTLDTNADKVTSNTELNTYLERVAVEYQKGLILKVDGNLVELELINKQISLHPGAGNLSTMRIELDFVGKQEKIYSNNPKHLVYEDKNQVGRTGWREIVVNPIAPISVFNSSAYSNSISDELKSYPQDMLLAPLNETSARLSFLLGAAPSGSKALLSRDGRLSEKSKDKLTELITVPKLTLPIALIGLLIAMALGGLHALAPGHGKTIVAAYLIGSRGTTYHALFLGITVTITHTIGVFALGGITLFATKYIMPEKIFLLLSLVSGLIVVAIGISLFLSRLYKILGVNLPAHKHNGFFHSHSTDENQTDDQGHSHLPIEGDSSFISWRSLLALGISGGLLPCPSALVVLLSAISLQRIGYGLLLVTAFSIGLAGVLTIIGLLFVYAKSYVNSSSISSNKIINTLPVVSAFIITCLGLGICYQSLGQADVFSNFNFSIDFVKTSWVSGLSAISLGFILGLKHAMEADHVAAVSTIVSEHKSIVKSSVVGALWGVGHTISLFLASIVVIFLKIEIPERTALSLEFIVAIMLITLGINALYQLIYHNKQVLQEENISNLSKVEEATKGKAFSIKPVIVGMVHGMAGSAALMLLVVSTSKSVLFSLIYILVFGVGSMGGMLLMSALISLPVHLANTKFTHMSLVIRTLAGIFSFGFGLFMTYEIGYVEGLFR